MKRLVALLLFALTACTETSNTQSGIQPPPPSPARAPAPEPIRTGVCPWDFSSEQVVVDFQNRLGISVSLDCYQNGALNSVEAIDRFHGVELPTAVTALATQENAFAALPVKPAQVILDAFYEWTPANKTMRLRTVDANQYGAWLAQQKLFREFEAANFAGRIEVSTYPPRAIEVAETADAARSLARLRPYASRVLSFERAITKVIVGRGHFYDSTARVMTFDPRRSSSAQQMELEYVQRHFDVQAMLIQIPLEVDASVFGSGESRGDYKRVDDALDLISSNVDQINSLIGRVNRVRLIRDLESARGSYGLKNDGVLTLEISGPHGRAPHTSVGECLGKIQASVSNDVDCNSR